MGFKSNSRVSGPVLYSLNRVAVAAAAVATGLLAQSAMAVNQPYTFTGNGAQSWTGAAWSPAGTPGIGDSATITSSGGALNFSFGAETSVGSLVLDGAGGVINIGNNVSTFGLVLDNAGGANNTDSNAANANPTITSKGAAANIISAPLSLTGAVTGTTSTSQITFDSTANLTLSGGVIVDNNTTTVVTAAGSTQGQTNGVIRTLQNNLAAGRTLTISGPITSRFSVPANLKPATAAPTNATVTITNFLQLGNRVDAPFNTQAWGDINVTGVIANGASYVDGVNNLTYVTNTGVQLGQGALNNTNNSIQTIKLSGNNTYSGGTQIFRANIIVDSNTAFGTGTVNSGSGASGNLSGFNIISTDDSRTLTNNVSLARNLSIAGTNSLTWAGLNGWTQSNTTTLFNLLPTAKTFTISTPYIATATGGDTGRIMTFDGSGTTVLSGKIVNNFGTNNLATQAPADTGTDGRISKAGFGLLKLTNPTNTYASYTASSGGIIEFAVGGSIGNSKGLLLNPGGAAGLDTGSLVHTPLANIPVGADGVTSLASMVKNAGSVYALQTSRGAIALAPADAAINIDYTNASSDFSDSKMALVGIGALPSVAPNGISYTGTITPANNTYRLGGGALLTMANTNALVDAAGPTARNLIVTNGGTVALAGSNTYTGVTTVEGNYIQSVEDLALQNKQFNTITTTAGFSAGNYQKSTLSIASTSSLGSAASTASNLKINGGVLKYTGTGGSTSRLFTIGTIGATLDASGTGAVDFTNTGANVSAEAPTDVTANVAASGNTLTLANDISNLAVGMTVTGAGIQPNTTIVGFKPAVGETGNVPAGVNYQNSIYLSLATNLAGTAVPLTFTTANRTLTLTGTNIADNNVSGVLANATTGTLGVTKTGTGTWKLSGANTYTGPTNVNAGKLKFGKALQNSGVLAIADGATAEVVASGAAASVTSVNTLTLGTLGNGKLELHDNDLIINYGAGPNAYADTVLKVKSGLVSLGGSGTKGIGSVEADGTVPGTSLAVVDNAVTALTSLSGFTIPNPTTSVLVKFTWLGDANLDGIVDGTDYALTDSGFAGGGTTWNQGDYNYSGGVDGTDYALIDTGFGSQSGTLPEPTALGLLGLGAMGMLRRRRRQA